MPAADRLAGPRATDRRAALLDQLRYLLVEVEVLGPMLERLPQDVLTGRPLPSDRSALEAFADLAAQDRAVHLPRLRAVVAEDEPAFEADPDVAVDAPTDIAAALAGVRDARTALLEAFERVPPADWSRTATVGGERRDLYALAFAITQHDAAVLRSLAYRLHESRLS